MEPSQPKQSKSLLDTLATLSGRWQGTNARVFTPSLQEEAMDLLITRFTDFFLSYSGEEGLLDATRRQIEATCGHERQLERVVWGAAILGLREALIILAGERSLTQTRQYLEKNELAPLEDIYTASFTRAEEDNSTTREALSKPFVEAYEEASRTIRSSWQESSYKAPQLLRTVHARWQELVLGKVSDSITSFVEHSLDSTEQLLAARSYLERSYMISTLRTDVAAAHDLIDELLQKKGPESP